MLPHRLFILTKFALFVKQKKAQILLGIGAFLVFSLGFSLGIIKGGQIISRPALFIDKELIVDFNDESVASNQLTAKGQSLFVASSQGKYYYPVDCSLAQNLSEKNKIYFQSKEEAEAKGYIYNTKCD